jgi:hypothetical protein
MLVLAFAFASALSMLAPTPISQTVAFRIDNFVRGLETSGVEARARVYQFRGMNLAETGPVAKHGLHASRESRFSVTSLDIIRS